MGSDLLVRFRVTSARQIELDGHESHRIKTGIRRAKIKEALNQEAGAGQKQQRKRDLRDNEEGT